MISTQNLSRTFQTKTGVVEAVRDLTMDVASGELVGFLGPNGAGKSTTLRMLTTLLRPTDGKATLAGHDLLREPELVRQNIGYVAQQHASADDQIVLDEIIFQGRLHGLAKARARARAFELAERLDFTDLLKRRGAQLSGGERRRVDIALGLVHSPSLVFLDEPSTGLDPRSRRNLWEHIRSLHRDDGITVFLTTHYLDEADWLCDRILVIDGGTVITEGSPEALKSRLGGDVMSVSTDDDIRAETLARGLIDVRDTDIDDRGVRITCKDGATALPELIRGLEQAGLAVQVATVRRPTLDDVFLSLTGRSIEAQEHLASPPAEPNTAQVDEAAVSPTRKS